MSSLIRKISAKSVCGKIEVPKSAKKLFVVFGHAQKTKSGTTDYGTWTALVGRFEAVNTETGEVFQSPQCFLPEPMQSMITVSLEELDDDGNRVTNSVQFSIEVGIKPSDVPIGYEYTTKEIVEADTADPLAALRDASKDALAAPKKKNGKKGNNKKS
jgi:hypothetical protein